MAFQHHVVVGAGVLLDLIPFEFSAVVKVRECGQHGPDERLRRWKFNDNNNRIYNNLHGNNPLVCDKG